jgi:Fe-S-cluster containining protein
MGREGCAPEKEVFMEKKFPDGMVPLGQEPFTFFCHKDISCFTVCCRKVDMFLFPYDVVCLKKYLQIESEEFLRRYTRLVPGHNPYFPSLMMLLQGDEQCCPFLEKSGCSVYPQRPSACRTYPLERAVDKNPGPGESHDFYFMTDHDYCKGHSEKQRYTVKEWIRNQNLDQYNTMNDLWAEIDGLFATNPWRGEGAGGEKQQLAFMVCYNIDGFRKFVEKNRILQMFRLQKHLRRRIETEDEELLKFGFEWIKLILSGKSSLVRQ